jgi:hypothetical protein
MRWGRAKRPDFWVLFAIVAGLILRFYHYGRNPSMWHDEAALVLNVMGKGFVALLGPLFFHEAGSPLFLWVERAAYLALGDSTYALRLIPFLASCASLLLFVPVAKRLLTPQAAAWAVLLFAFSDTLLWHACEAKPYGVDAFCATLLLAAYCATHSWPVGRKLLLYAGLAPFIVFLSYPGCFLFGGLLLALVPEIWQAENVRAWFGYALLIVAVFGSFALLVAGPAHAQRCEAMDQCWLKSFLPWDRPWKIPLWVVDSTLDVVRYACEPTGKALAVPAVVGGLFLYRRGMRRMVLFLATPIALALAASCLRAYPFGGTRVMIYAGPAVFLFVAAGVPVCLDYLRPRTRLGTAAVLLLVLTPIGHSMRHVFYHWGRADCAGAAAYVLEHRQPRDLVTGNSWEYWYYFRNIKPSFMPTEEMTFPVQSRLWVAYSGATSEERAQFAHLLELVQGKILEERDFDQTKVLLTEASDHFEPQIIMAKGQ